MTVQKPTESEVDADALDDPSTPAVRASKTSTALALAPGHRVTVAVTWQ
ncbi:hypothetical protein [Sorangium sp. So ce854]